MFVVAAAAAVANSAEVRSIVDHNSIHSLDHASYCDSAEVASEIGPTCVGSPQTNHMVLFDPAPMLELDRRSGMAADSIAYCQPLTQSVE